MTMTEPASRGITLVLHPVTDFAATLAAGNSAGSIANEPVRDEGDRHSFVTVAEPNGNVASPLWGRA